MIRVILVEDHVLFRMGIRGALSGYDSNIYIAGEVDNGGALFGLLSAGTKADVVLLDVILPDMSGIAIAARLRQEYPEIKILVLSSDNTVQTVQALVDIGIDGFISKRQATSDELKEAIETLMNEEKYFGRDIASIIYNVYVSKKKSAEATAEFTDRELEIIGLCRKGFQCKEIADRLCISPRTVDTHKNNIFKKMGINSTLELVSYALKRGIIMME